MPAANTKECFSEFIGQKVVGVLFDAVPVSRMDLAIGNKTLIFEDGRGLTISSKGTYWIETAEDIAAAARKTARHLRDVEKHLAGVLDLAGADRVA